MGVPSWWLRGFSSLISHCRVFTSFLFLYIHSYKRAHTIHYCTLGLYYFFIMETFCFPKVNSCVVVLSVSLSLSWSPNPSKETDYTQHNLPKGTAQAVCQLLLHPRTSVDTHWSPASLPSPALLSVRCLGCCLVCVSSKNPALSCVQFLILSLLISSFFSFCVGVSCWEETEKY